MRTKNTTHDQQTISEFNLHKVLTISDLCTQLDLSVATVRRRLKEWQALSSYNQSGRFYTLPSIPQFTKQGLWKFQGAFFSKHGTLKNTVIHFVRISKSGLSNAELEQILEVNPNSYLPQCKQLVGVKREKHHREVVYYSSEEQQYQRQKRTRFPPEPTAVKLPPDAIGIIVMVELVKNPGSTPEELTRTLLRDGYQIDLTTIENLLEYHGLKKNRI